MGLARAERSIHSLPNTKPNIKSMETSRIKELIPNKQDTITTKEIAAALNISTPQAYRLCLMAEKEGWLFKFGYKAKDGGYLPVETDEPYKRGSITWQHSEEA